MFVGLPETDSLNLFTVLPTTHSFAVLPVQLFTVSLFARSALAASGDPTSLPPASSPVILSCGPSIRGTEMRMAIMPVRPMMLWMHYLPFHILYVID